MKTAVMPAEAVPPEAPKSNRNQSTDCAETRKTVSSHQALAEPIMAGLAGTPHPCPQKWQNRPCYGRRLPPAGQSSSLSILWALFSKRTQMMAPVKTEKHRFSVENVCFDVRGRANQEGVFTKRTQMIQPRQMAFHRLLQCRRTSHSQQPFQAATALSATACGCGAAALGSSCPSVAPQSVREIREIRGS